MRCYEEWCGGECIGCEAKGRLSSQISYALPSLPTILEEQLWGVDVVNDVVETSA